MSIRSVFTCIVALLSTTGWAQYALEDDYLADGNFFDMFSFFTSSDPTHGSVSYVDQNTASNGGLIHMNNGQVYMGVDHTNLAPNGRSSVRITSNKSYNSGLVILDLQKMPGGICGTWPAFWMVGSNWPNNGEIDIIEGVNDQSTNAMTLHTNSGCGISNTGAMTGTVETSNCDVNAPGQGTNQGCSIGTGNSQTYGAGFNANGGGVYATEWTSSYIKIFFFPRGSIPGDITAGIPNPAGWGSPVALFQGSCSMPDHFKDLQIVFDTTFCGDWAGATWGNSQCASKASSCQAFVANNPSAFQDANWLINSLKVYQPIAWTGNAAAAPAPAAPAPVVPAASPVAAPSPAASTPDSSVPAGHVVSTGDVTGAPAAISSPAPAPAPAPAAPPAGHIVSFGDVTGPNQRRAARHLAAHLKRGIVGTL